MICYPFTKINLTTLSFRLLYAQNIQSDETYLFLFSFTSLFTRKGICQHQLEKFR